MKTKNHLSNLQSFANFNILVMFTLKNAKDEKKVGKGKREKKAERRGEGSDGGEYKQECERKWQKGENYIYMTTHMGCAQMEDILNRANLNCYRQKSFFFPLHICQPQYSLSISQK